MKKIKVQKYEGYGLFGDTHKKSGVFAFLVKKGGEATGNLRVARIFEVQSGDRKGELMIQAHRHGATEKKYGTSNDWIPIYPDLILPLIKVLQQWYLELCGEEAPEVAEPKFEAVKDDKELTKMIEDIGLK
jgi:hypothetical protein